MPRPRRGAYIYRRKGRRGLYAFIDANTKHISLKTDDETEGYAELTRLLESRKIRILEAGERSLADAFTASLESAKTSCTPKSIYEVDLNNKRILRWCDSHGAVTTRDITAETIDAYKTSRIRFDKVGPARVNRELDTWKRAMKWAVEHNAYSERNLSLFKHLREPRPLPHRPGLTAPMLMKFLRAEKHAVYKALFRTVIGTGMRDEELRRMEASDIRPPWIVVTPKAGWSTKGYRHRSIPVSKETVNAARLLVKKRDEISADPKTLWKRIGRVRKRAGIKVHFSMHDFRRAWASHMLAAGHRVEDISQWLGHADVMTTMRYLRVIRTGVPKPESLPF